MKVEVKNNSVFEIGLSRKKKKTLIIDGHKLKPKDKIHYTCESCGKETLQTFLFKEKFLNKKFLCKKCSTVKTNLNKYGVKHPLQNEEVKEKLEKTNIEKYGEPHPFRFHSKRLDEIIESKHGDKNYNNREKFKKTNIERYGSKNPFSFQSSLYKRNIYRKYGVKNISQLDEVKVKIRDEIIKTSYIKIIKTNRLKNKVTPMFNIEDYSGVANKYQWQCCKCGHIFEDNLDDGKIPRCPKCQPYLKNTSKFENEINDWLTKSNFDTIKNSRNILDNIELDIYIPKYKLAIEANGVYWHSVEYKDKYYHQNKVKLCYNKNIRLLHIWEDNWTNNPEEVKEKILYYINSINEEIKPREPILEERMSYKIWN